MRTRILFYILFLQCTFTISAQIPCDTILYDNANYYLITDEVCYKWQWNKTKKEYVLYKDTTLLSVNIPYINFESYFIDKKNNKFYWGNNKDFWYFDFNNDSLFQAMLLRTSENYIISTITDGKVYYSDYTSLHIIDLATHSIIDTINIGKNFKYHLINELIKFSNTKNSWLILADLDGGEATDEKYYVYDEVSKQYSLSKENNILQKINEDNYYGIRCYDLSRQYVFRGEFIYDSKFNLFGKTNIFNINIYGIVISNREIKQLILKSNLDKVENEKEQRYVLIPFIPNPFKEKAMYQIYENIELNAKDLECFDTFDLRILRNMIFAKHNYAFKDKFLQAYFNLYGFYGGNNDRNRLMDVNHLLTPEDNKNLELIQQVNKNKK